MQAVRNTQSSIPRISSFADDAAAIQGAIADGCTVVESGIAITRDLERMLRVSKRLVLLCHLDLKGLSIAHEAVQLVLAARLFPGRFARWIVVLHAPSRTFRHLCTHVCPFRSSLITRQVPA